MHLYSRDISPFAARARFSILAKGLSVRIIDNPDVSAADFVEHNPLRRVPVLVLDDDTALPESDTIVEYLEDRFPEVPLRPVEPLERARVRLISRIAELYVFPAVLPIFGALRSRDSEQINELLDKLDHELANLASFLDGGNKSWHAFGQRLTTADGALASFLFYAHFIGKACGRTLLTRQPKLERFWEGAQSDSATSTIIQQMAQAMAAVSERTQG